MSGALLPGHVHCPHYAAARCRSCGWIERDYTAQLTDKQDRARAALPGLAAESWLPPIGSALAGFRNKAKMAVGGSVEAPLLGLVEADRAQVDLADCLLYPAAIQQAFGPIRDFIRAARLVPYDLVTRRGELKFVLLTMAPHDGRLLLRFVLRSREPLDRLRKQLASLQSALPAVAVVSANLQPVHQAVLEGPDEILLTDQAALDMQVNEIPLALRPGGFFQTNSALAAALYAQVRDWCTNLAARTVWDLYSGVGGFALHCAAPGRIVTGVESHPDGVHSARQSAAALGLDAHFVCADATAWVQSQHVTPDLVIVNPPRRGLGPALSAWLQQSGVPDLIYSSCSVDSLVADLKRMPAYTLLQGRVLDMFAHTPHFEVVVRLRRSAERS